MYCGKWHQCHQEKQGWDLPPQLRQQKVTHSESKRADTEHKETAPAMNRHPVAGAHLLKHHCHCVMKMATIFTQP